MQEKLKEQGTYSLFDEMPESFSSSIGDKQAIMLWMMLDVKRRKEFIDAMHVVLDAEGPYWENIAGRRGGLFRDGIKWHKENYLDLTRKIMLSQASFGLLKDCYYELFSK